jgi:uncharacterized protein with HEPN domain
MLDYKIYINQINEFIERIEKTTKNISKEDFIKDINLLDSTIMRLQVIGETIKNIPYEIKKENKQVKWKLFSRLRNFISHKYVFIDPEIIYNLILEKIPELKEQINSVKIKRMKGGKL